MKFLEVYKKENFLAKRNLGLDLIRSVAIMLVLLAHVGIDGPNAGGLRLGGLGVEIFFVLSGFLIGQILIKNFSKELSVRSIFDFWVRRWFRTLPLYYLVIILKFVLIDHSMGYKILVYFFFLQNNFVGIDFMPVTWSLVVEEWFYLTLPVVLYIFFYKRSLTSRSLTIFIVGFILFVTVARFLFVWYTNRGYAAIVGNFPFRLDSMMCGVLIANLKINYKEVYLNLRSLRVFLSVLFLYLFVLVWFAQLGRAEENMEKNILAPTVWLILNSMCIALLLPYVEDKVKIGSQNNIFRILISGISIFSYCAYLIHMEVYRLFLSAPLFSLTWVFQAFTAMVVTFLVAAVTYGLYEKPMTDLREKFKAGNVI